MALRRTALGCTHIAADSWFSGGDGTRLENRESRIRLAQPMDQNQRRIWSTQQSTIASRTRFVRVSRFLAWVWQPRRVGTLATYQPSSSRLTITVNSDGDFTIRILAW